MSSCSSTSPESRSTGLPTTPSSSDDEFFSYYSSPLPSFNARRVSIKPLVITKHHSMSSPSENFPSISTSPFKNANETTALSPLFEENTDEEESDSEWYNQEFSKILTLCSPLPPIAQKSRPESLCVPSSSTSSTPPKTTTTRPRGFPSAQLDPAFPRRRSRIIPTYPPPPVPVVPEHLRSPPATPPKPSRARCNALTLTPPPVRRPPPRSSIPADCVLVDETFTFSDDTASTFSLSLYDSSPSPAAAESPKSFYSQQSFQLPASPLPPSFPSTPVHSSTEFDFPVGVDEHEIQFAMDMDMDRPMLLPLSLPTSPIDLARDIATGLEALRAAPQPQHPSPATHDANVVTAPARTSTKQQRRRPDADSDSRELRSRWSSSTLGSIHEEHARRTGTSSGLGGAASAKLRAVFGALPASPGPKTVRMRTSRRSDSVSGAGSAIPQTPVTPTSPAPGKRFRHARRESDVMALGYGYVPVVSPLRRRGSTSPSVSDAGSEESASSAGSSGLRRKPIPVEMFLRSA
ncbi:hypothetical protein H0H81_010987 [Sphagnurus paluster]|uniref:Uncharacterized protein n=1 Tax=Sphagnurus paluster TaxID=117069 RepID=A0A9P7KME9_9AGAR|nr:hypothetical protein H0H81_010987 [Sphagnurus paluster]